MFASAKSLVQKPVGVRYFPATESHPPFRVFYPTHDDIIKSCRPFRWLEERGVSYFIIGYLRSMLKHSWLLEPFIPLVSFLFPMYWKSIANVYSNAPYPTTTTTSLLGSADMIQKLPAIVFSHGLTGTGQENAVLLAAWASLGFYVLSIHHTDGSSSRVRLADGSDLNYSKGPSFQNYDENFRPKQLEHRAQEIMQICDYCLHMQKQQQQSSSENYEDSVEFPNIERFAAITGFSYGAATAARIVTLDDKRLFQTAIFLDGWFYIDVSHSANIEFPFPKQAFEQGINLPSLFVNSEQFSKDRKLFPATRQLTQTKNGSNDHPLHVIQGTGHQNFCDVVFWIPQWLLKRLGRLIIGMLGGKDPTTAYREVVDITSDFLIQHHCQEDNNNNNNNKKDS